MAGIRVIAGVFMSAGLHVLAYTQMSHAKSAGATIVPPVVIEVDTAPPPPPPPPREPEEEKRQEAPLLARPVAPAKAAAAQAGRVLAANDDAPGVADFTMVQGSGTTYAGGVTTSSGTARVASAGARGEGPSGNGGGAGDAGGTADLSKPARPSSGDWDCKALFPASASTDAATVVIVARVRPDGSPESISVVNDPGQGFGQAARACALRQRFSAAEDRSGRAVASSTAPFRVRFTR